MTTLSSSSSTTNSGAPAGRQVARAALIVMLLFVASRVLGLVREGVVSYHFGTGPEFAAYQAAFRLPDLLFNLMAGGALTSAFLPVFTNFLAREDREGAWRLASAVGTFILIGLGVVAVLVAWGAPWLVEHLITPGDGFTPEMRALTVSLMRLMLISTVIFSLSGLVMAILNSFEHFIMPALAPLIYNLGIILGAVAFAPRWGIYGLAYGIIVGAFGHLLIQMPVLMKYGARYAPTFGLRDPALAPRVREVGWLMAPRVLGVATVQLNFLVNTVLASTLPPEAMGGLYYGWILMLLPQGIFALSIATAIFPTFAAQVARGEQEAMSHSLGLTLRAVLFMTLPAAVGLMVLRVPLVRLLLERGAFDELSTTVGATALFFYSMGLVGHSLLEILTRAFYALHDTLSPVIFGVAAMGLNIVLSLLMMPLFGAPGDVSRLGALALANSLATTLEMVILLWYLRRKVPHLNYRQFVIGGLRLGMAALLMGAGLALLQRSPLAGLSLWLYLPLALLVGVVIYLSAAWLLRAEEVRVVPRLLLRRGGTDAR